jgi:hypothetical protein
MASAIIKIHSETNEMEIIAFTHQPHKIKNADDINDTHE